MAPRSAILGVWSQSFLALHSCIVPRLGLAIHGIPSAEDVVIII